MNIMVGTFLNISINILGIIIWACPYQLESILVEYNKNTNQTPIKNISAWGLKTDSISLNQGI